jgi:tRNA A37 threonylcarbamoyladenosine dehydratase
VLVVGLGGVGSYAAEFLCRAGIGNMTIADGDRVDPSNKNRQLVALDSTVNLPKADIMAARMQDINPALNLTVIKEFLTPDLMMDLATPKFDWVIDCIDSLQPKLYFLGAAVTNGVKVASSMGAGGRVDPQKIRIAPIFETDCCRFAYKVRKGLRRKGFANANIMAVYSEELVNRGSLQLTDGSNFKRSYYGTISYLPALFGINLASVVIRDLMK